MGSIYAGVAVLAGLTWSWTVLRAAFLFGFARPLPALWSTTPRKAICGSGFNHYNHKNNSSNKNYTNKDIDR